jgi:5-methylcytosine-specific restriction endonuclease McrA
MGGDTTLHVHHKTYRNFGMEDMDDLEVLCKVCHQNEHRRLKY